MSELAAKPCTKCLERPRAPRQRYCAECRNAYARAWNAKQAARMRVMEDELADLRAKLAVAQRAAAGHEVAPVRPLAAQVRAHEERGILGS